MEQRPFLHARLARIGGEPVRRDAVPRDVAWAVRGDRGVSWSAAPPPDSRITAGAWWPADHAGPPLASLDAAVARRLGIAVGDRLTLNIQGRPLEATVANLRQMDWTRLRLDFPIVLSPPARPPPHSHVAAVWADAAALDAVEAAAALRVPEAAPIRIAPLLDDIGAMVRGTAAALTLASGVAVAATLAVLAGSLAAGYRRRVHETVLLKVLGARPRQLVLACVVELTLLGLATAAVAAVLGTAGAHAVVTRITPDGWLFPPLVPAVLAALAVAGFAAAGLLLPRRALAAPPAALLRRPPA
jgi:putative ABC transport system permease protein